MILNLVNLVNFASVNWLLVGVQLNAKLETPLVTVVAVPLLHGKFPHFLLTNLLHA